MASTQHLLDIRNLVTRFYTEEGVVHAVNDVSYMLDEGETLGVVGESGCGKSVHALSIMRLIASPPGKIEGGQILFRGRDLLTLSDDDMRRVRGAEIAMIFQDPMTSLNPVKTVGFQIMEALMLHEGMDKTHAKERTAELLDLVGIPEAKQRVDDYPHQFSGGMRQRAMIAMGLSCNPSILIADEPTTALDVTIQAQIVDLVRRLQQKLGMTVIWITHDLGVVAGLAQRVNVMYAGKIIEAGPVKQIYSNPNHPYTVGLLGSLPSHGTKRAARLFSIPGEPPDLVGGAVGCAFAARCNYKVPRCLQETPKLEEVAPGHIAACWEKDKVRRV
ncbi:MAG TPA: ABC transporter ATP-binding protein [Anaerolineae bacterium]|nr:ABC transporter ATP-binding protein [Anaerolineae bacterium]